MKVPNAKPSGIVKPTPPPAPPAKRTKLQQLRECLQDMVEERRRVNTAIAKLKMEITIEERMQARAEAGREMAV